MRCLQVQAHRVLAEEVIGTRLLLYGHSAAIAMAAAIPFASWRSVH